MPASAERGAEFVDRRAAERPDVVTPLSTRADLHRIYRDGLGRGDGVGWENVNEYFTVAPGQVTTVTGWPNSGKSQWLDNVIINLTRSRWRVCYCSLENIPVYLHLEKLAKLWIGKPLRHGPTERMSEDEIDGALNDMEELFSFVVPTDMKPNPSLSDVMVAFEEDFRRRELWGVEGVKLACVIDPWNELEHFRPHGMSLTEYVGESLSRLRQWARRNLMHVFLVGHPAKQPRDKGGKLPVPMPDMISDSAHFWNKSDNCITVHLPDDHNSPTVDIYVQKIRFGHIGKRGMATLQYDVTTGRYWQPRSPGGDPKFPDDKDAF